MKRKAQDNSRRMSEPKLQPPDASGSSAKKPAPSQGVGRRQLQKSLNPSLQDDWTGTDDTGEEPFPASELDWIPDVRDGLTRRERVVLWVLHEAQREFNGRNIATAMLYGRVVEYIDMSVDELQRILQRLIGIR
jgi:hypothetical protein